MNGYFRVGILGATGMVGQKFVSLLSEHPFFKLCVLAASENSAGKTFENAVKNRKFFPVNEKYECFPVLDAEKDFKTITENCDILFSALKLGEKQTASLEERYAKAEKIVISNNSAQRFFPDVPMVIPEINPDHLAVVPFQKKRLGTKRGFCAVKSNCSLQSFLPLLHPLLPFGIERVNVCTLQSVSGEGKTLETADLNGNVLPFIAGEEEKSEKEPMKIWGKIRNGKIVCATEPVISAQCFRVPVLFGHTAYVHVKFKQKPRRDDIVSAWKNYEGTPQKFRLPSAPVPFIRYDDSPFRPQPLLEERISEMSVFAGRLKETQDGFGFVGFSDNIVRGAAGGAILLAELIVAYGLCDEPGD